MQTMSIIITVIIIIFMVYLFCNIGAINDRYYPIKTDEELGYLLRNYEDFHHIQSYKDSLTYLFLHMDKIRILYHFSGEEITIGRLYNTYYLNGTAFNPDSISTDKLWKFISSQLNSNLDNMYTIKISYASGDLNPAPIYNRD